MVISDWNMEPMTGLELLQHVRSDPKLKATPFIMVTAESKTETVVAAKQAGVSNDIVKPFNAETLRGKIQKCSAMREPASDSEGNSTLYQLRERLESDQAMEPYANSVPAEDIMSAVLGTLNGRLSTRETMLLREIAGLARIIEQAKPEIAEVSVDEIRGSHIPSATGEFDAIVEHTAVARESILESCELLDGLVGSFEDKQAAIVQDVTTRIYEAGSFQDITGQRITKVVKALKAIEAKVLMLSGAGHRAGAAIKQIELATGPTPLLNGPMLPHEAMGQDDIDKLLADFR